MPRNYCNWLRTVANDSGIFAVVNAYKQHGIYKRLRLVANDSANLYCKLPLSLVM